MNQLLAGVDQHPLVAFVALGFAVVFFIVLGALLADYLVRRGAEYRTLPVKPSRWPTPEPAPVDCGDLRQAQRDRLRATIAHRQN